MNCSLVPVVNVVVLDLSCSRELRRIQKENSRKTKMKHYSQTDKDNSTVCLGRGRDRCLDDQSIKSSTIIFQVILPKTIMCLFE